MPKPVFPVVRLPYDRPDRVTRVLEAVRREFVAASRRRPPLPPPPVTAEPSSPGTMTARLHQPQTGESAERATGTTQPAAAADDQTVVDQVTVGVRDCTLTPKARRPDILVTAGARHDDQQQQQQQQHRDGGFCDDGGVGGPYLLVPPVNITAEISRPPLQYYTATS